MATPAPADHAHRDDGVTADDLEPRRHAPPAGWDRDVFENVTDALAAVLVAAIKREEDVKDGSPSRAMGAQSVEP
jgi:hypothetical protein